MTHDLDIRVCALDRAELAAYAEIPIAFEVRRILHPGPERPGEPFPFSERPVPTPWVKDYDAEPGGSPLLWADRFDLDGWWAFSAWVGTQRAGGLVLVQGNPAVDMLDGRSDLGLIWDIRIAPGQRGRGIGARLLEAAASEAAALGCTELKVETQNINAPACRFYARNGFSLRSFDPTAYPELPDEIQMLYYRPLVSTGSGRAT